ncbi:Leucine-rich repeat and calponin y domain-containing protein 1 [Liparis tanakae]|uniref:Leucine-rich repeat and calponin y domain-containing protein 1 n=1 Tax=Liparis tanakae TaxID=230148 RepID=A0A4Z2I9K6_9TELE|nr:Leucine-rich repeat and calponin y domain-containing protein 1 [Liparis tanakae]
MFHIGHADLSKNRLADIPSEVCHLVALETLNLYHNCIRTIPDIIIGLQSLTSLNLSTTAEGEAYHLASLPLVKFDFSCNKVSTIPICIKGKVHIFKYLSIEACRSEKMPDSLYLPVIERLSLSRPATGSVEDMEQQKKQDSDSGVGSDNGDKRLSATEPSDEDSLSLNIPMSHITEEEGMSKDDSSEHISSLTDPNSDSVRLIEESPTEALKDQFNYRDAALSTRFVNYIKARLQAASPQSKVTGGTELHIDMINQLQEAVELLQDPGRANTEQDDRSGVRLYPVEMVTVEESLNGQDSDDGITTPKLRVEEGVYEFQKKRQMILEKARFEAQLACRQYEWRMSIKRNDRSHASGPPSFSSPVFGLKPRSGELDLG